ncbi:MAG: hypothetical protein KZQ97_20135 [Candidatus Thiodiazotropha sp. (ex Dulcina madagascariensis)]|nr:hypothetical protein [Candidatus Thiodiazotropha sp. (ex Dulcina madagascariensis)]
MSLSRLLLTSMLLFLSACQTAPTTTDNLQAVEERTFDAPAETLYRLSIDTVAGLGWAVSDSDPSAGLIEAGTPATMKSFGNQVTVQITASAPEKSLVKVTSRSRRATRLEMNKTNITQFYQALSQNLADR